MARKRLERWWKNVFDSSKYQINPLGEFRNRETGKKLKPATDRYGYLKLAYRGDSGKTHYATIHRLVALAFIKNPEGKPQVNHINGNKKDNRRINLEWSTSSENISHSFETGLNPNKMGIVVTDILSGAVTPWRSIKSFSKYLGLSQSVLTPLIKHSDKNPILGQYVIKLVDKKELFTANTVNFGRTIYVFDAITGELSQYKSLLLASYETGVRSISNITRSQLPMVIAGYYFSFSVKNLPYEYEGDIESLLDEREVYHCKPYTERECWFEIHDYRKSTTHHFKTLGEMTEVLNDLPPKDVCFSKNKVSQKLGDGQKRSKTSLAKGYGIRSDKVNFTWFPYTEEVLLSSSRCFKAPQKFFSVTNRETMGKEVVCGVKDLCDYVGYILPASKVIVPFEKLVKFAEQKNLVVRRLNTPIQSH